MAEEFKQEMRRFLPVDNIKQGLDQEKLWDFIGYLIEDLGHQIHKKCV
jgi:hypothetical protein